MNPLITTQTTMVSGEYESERPDIACVSMENSNVVGVQANKNKKTVVRRRPLEVACSKQTGRINEINADFAEDGESSVPRKRRRRLMRCQVRRDKRGRVRVSAAEKLRRIALYRRRAVMSNAIALKASALSCVPCNSGKKCGVHNGEDQPTQPPEKNPTENQRSPNTNCLRPEDLGLGSKVLKSSSKFVQGSKSELNDTAVQQSVRPVKQVGSLCNREQAGLPGDITLDGRPKMKSSGLRGERKKRQISDRSADNSRGITSSHRITTSVPNSTMSPKVDTQKNLVVHNHVDTTHSNGLSRKRTLNTLHEQSYCTDSDVLNVTERSEPSNIIETSQLKVSPVSQMKCIGKTNQGATKDLRESDGMASDQDDHSSDTDLKNESEPTENLRTTHNFKSHYPNSMPHNRENYSSDATPHSWKRRKVYNAGGSNGNQRPPERFEMHSDKPNSYGMQDKTLDSQIAIEPQRNDTRITANVYATSHSQQENEDRESVTSDISSTTLDYDHSAPSTPEVCSDFQNGPEEPTVNFVSTAASNSSNVEDLRSECDSVFKKKASKAGFVVNGSKQALRADTIETNRSEPSRKSGSSNQEGNKKLANEFFVIDRNRFPDDDEDWLPFRVNWEEPTFMENINCHGVYYTDPNSSINAMNRISKLYKICEQSPVGILKKKPCIKDPIKTLVHKVKQFDLISDALDPSPSTVKIIQDAVCPQYWSGLECEKKCNKMHHVYCDSFPSVSHDEAFRVISCRLIELKKPSLRMIASFLEWLTQQNELVKVLSFSKILHANKGLNECTHICSLLIKCLCKLLDSKGARAVEFFLKYQYYLTNKTKEDINVIMNKMIAYCNVGTYKYQVVQIVLFLLKVQGYRLPVDILDKVLFEIDSNYSPPDISLYTEDIKKQIMLHANNNDQNFRQRAAMFLQKYFPEVLVAK